MSLRSVLLLLFITSLSPNILAQEPLLQSLNKVRLEFTIDEKGTPLYSVYHNNKRVIQPSSMGFMLADDSTFYYGFEIEGSEKRSVDETWTPIWGEVNTIRDHYEELVVHLKQKEGQKRLLNIAFRVFEDGIAFRYMFPKQANLNYFIVSEERTEFNLPGDHKTFWIPGDYDTNEYAYTTSKLSEIDNRELVAKSTDIAVRVAPDPFAVQTPLMMKTGEGLYINIHEAALIDYPAMQLHVNKNALGLLSKLVPDAVGNKAYLHAPCKTPWRTIIISDKAAEILSSKTILNLNDAAQPGNYSWIQPMKFVGVWWEMQTGKSTWSYANSIDDLTAERRLLPNGRHGANTANVKRYIDFAATNGIKGVLVEGWNTGWEDWFGNWKDKVFDFVTPYPDFNLTEITRYASAKGVKLIMHNETSGSVSNYERQIDTAFKLMNAFGYTSVKTGYVGKIIPRGEHHDGQYMVNHYTYVAQKGMEHAVMIDAHEPVRPTGLHRTYPNWMASEAGRGNEYNAFSNGNAPDHETILPFTRLMGGPMDYTPGIFKLTGYSTVAGRQVHTTLCKQLALYVTMYSPLQMVADLPENYEAKKDAFQFIKDVPVDWDDTKVLEAEPGDYITIARKEKGKDNWFIGAITDENSRQTNLPLTFLAEEKKYLATIYADKKDADWKTNPEAYQVKQITVTRKSTISLNLAKGGGAAISIIEK